VQGAGCRVEGVGCRVQGAGFREAATSTLSEVAQIGWRVEGTPLASVTPNARRAAAVNALSCAAVQAG